MKIVQARSPATSMHTHSFVRITGQLTKLSKSVDEETRISVLSL